MRFTKQRTILLLLLVFAAIISLVIAQKPGIQDEFVVKNLAVNDVPADDGTGLVISWEPLSREKRIIEYRIYRGISEDQLFFHGSIPVNVKTGVAADTMFFYDSSWTEFIDIKSPGKLRKERKQAEDSPLYRKIPRDVKIAAELSKKLSILSVIPKNDYYYRSKKSFSANEADSTAYAGMLLRQQSLLAKLKPGEQYFYTIVAVDEKNNYHPFAPISSGIPKDNPPDPATDFYSVMVEDTQKLQFEWEYPLFSDDLYTWKVLMMPALEAEDWNLRRKEQNFAGLSMRPIAMGQVNSMGSDSAKNYHILDMAELLQSGVSIDQIKNSAFVLELMDYSGVYLSQSAQSKLNVVLSDALPPKPEYQVVDKPNDKGDRLTVVWDQPIVFATQTSMVGRSGKKLRVNYQLNTTETQSVQNIYFDFFKKGETKAFTTINEFYPDNKVFLNIPADYDYKQGFRVRMTMKGKPQIPADYVLEQDLEWNDQMMTLMPGKKLFRNGVEVSNLGNVVYRKRPNTPFYTNIKKNTSFDNNLDISIPYETSIFKIVNGFNYVEDDSLVTIFNGTRYTAPAAGKSRTALALVAQDIDVIFDADNGRTVMTSIYRDEALKSLNLQLDKAKSELEKLKSDEAALQTLPAGADKDGMQKALTSQIEAAEKRLGLLQNEHLVKANEIESNRGRMRYIAKTRETDKRRQAFTVVRTNGKGLFNEAEPIVDADGNPAYLIPVSNWFDRNKIVTLIASLIFTITVFSFISLSKRGKDLYIRPIAGLAEIDNAIGRATEMGRPMMYCTGGGGLSDVATLASLGILGLVAKRAAEYDTKLIVPCYDYMVMPIAQEIVRDAHYEVGRPDSYDKNNIFYLTNVQFAYVAGVNGIMIRERAATNFFLGFFAAEALLMTETGNFIGAVQIAGTDAITQIPFFITTCDYTLIGEELYAASAYLNREPMLLGTLKGQDYYKFLILSFILAGTILSSFQFTQITRLFPTK